jgi:hypothetical protein
MPKEGKREVTYTAYGENIEATVKLLSCNRTVLLIDKDDIKKNRMFITSYGSG